MGRTKEILVDDDLYAAYRAEEDTRKEKEKVFKDAFIAGFIDELRKTHKVSKADAAVIGKGLSCLALEALERLMVCHSCGKPKRHDADVCRVEQALHYDGD